MAQLNKRQSLLSGLLLGGLLALSTASAQAASARDPLEGLNRAIFAFNDATDAVAIRPIAAFYDKVTPRPAQTGVSNFFGNISDINASLNAVLQGRFERAAESAGRVAVNSTLGFFGLFDVATDMGISQYQTDFGHTLSIWGLPQGPYVVLPLFGPSTATSAIGFGVDGFLSPAWRQFEGSTAWQLRGVLIVDSRASLLDTDQLVSGDRYLFLRDVYLQGRDTLINDGNTTTDSFSEFGSGWEEDEF